jgi:acetylornithine deacetylase/succinyl-diaminopimelate desuccinylase-like protein
MEVITGDALEYELAPEAQVLFFYSPFSADILDRVLQRIEGSLQQSPRDLLIVFSGTLAVLEKAFGSRPQYECLRRERYMDIYRHR